MRQKNTAKPIIIDATSRVFYASFYIKGLQDLYGKKNVSFLAQNLKDLNRKEVHLLLNFAFKIVLADTDIKKIVIDFCDSLDVNEMPINGQMFMQKLILI
jgi:hypothetical protein